MSMLTVNSVLLVLGERHASRAHVGVLGRERHWREAVDAWGVLGRRSLMLPFAIVLKACRR